MTAQLPNATIAIAASIALAQGTAPATGGGDEVFWLAAGIVLLAIGLLLGVLELFIPTGGVLAIATATCLVGSVACFFGYSTLWGFASLALYAAGAPFALVFGLKLWTKTPIARSMVLGTSEDDEGEQSASDAMRHGSSSLRSLLGAQGVTVTPMRPVGFVRIGSERIEAVAEMGMIESGAAVEVIEASAARIVVRQRG